MVVGEKIGMISLITIVSFLIDRITKIFVVNNIDLYESINVIDNFFIGNITDIALINSLSALELGRQYVAVTQKACDLVRIEKEVVISHLERLAMKEIAGLNRAKGISYANDICKKHRREGMYYDEILDSASNGG